MPSNPDQSMPRITPMARRGGSRIHGSNVCVSHQALLSGSERAGKWEFDRAIEARVRSGGIEHRVIESGCVAAWRDLFLLRIPEIT